MSVNRALQNPGIFTSTHYRQAAIAVAAGVAIRLIVSIPVCAFQTLFYPYSPPEERAWFPRRVDILHMYYGRCLFYAEDPNGQDSRIGCIPLCILPVKRAV